MCYNRGRLKNNNNSMADKKTKLSNKETIDILVKNIKELRDNVNSLMEESDKGKISKELTNIFNDNQFILDATIKFHSLPDIEKQKKDFFDELRALMIKYKIYSLVANLTKRF